MNKLMNTNTKKYKSNIKSYILDCIDTNEADKVYKNPESETAKLQYLMDRFRDEFVFEFNIRKFRGNIYLMLQDYLMGLPFGFDFEKYRILEVAKKVHELDSMDSATEDKIIENWWEHIAFQTIYLLRKNELSREMMKETQHALDSYRIRSLYSGNWTESV